jgi:hypothetical protein
MKWLFGRGWRGFVWLGRGLLRIAAVQGPWQIPKGRGQVLSVNQMFTALTQDRPFKIKAEKARGPLDKGR